MAQLKQQVLKTTERQLTVLRFNSFVVPSYQDQWKTEKDAKRTISRIQGQYCHKLLNYSVV